MNKKELEEENRKKDKRIENLENEICDLRKRLQMYENAHTPPSKTLFKKKSCKSSGKIGAKKGHPKYERIIPFPNEIIEYPEEKCPHCSSKLGKPCKTESFFEEEIPEPQPVKVIQHKVNSYICSNCKKKVLAKNNAPRGSFGKNLLSHVTLLKFEDRLPLRKVEKSLLRNYNINITNPGIYGMTKQVAKKLKYPYYEIMKRIRGAEVIYIDETQYKLNGKTWWLWTFVTKTDVLFVIRESRGKKVLEEILGRGFKGKIVCDGWRVYSNFAKILQRCWAHLLRECDKLEEDYKDFKKLNNQIHQLFKKISRILENPPPPDQRKILYKKMKLELEKISHKMTSDYRFRRLGKKILNGIDSWFTCVLFPEIRPTNNFAEQSLRELIVQRKITGGLRSEDGAKTLEVVASCLTTWKKQNKPLFNTLRSHL